MVRNEERREVANWLRLSGDSLALDNCFVRFLRDTAGSDLPTEDFNAASYLAELIERPTTRDVGADGTFECERCHAERLPEWLLDQEFHYCPDCGAEVIE